jgi:ribonucleoside-triphosphate reductase
MFKRSLRYPGIPYVPELLYWREYGRDYYLHPDQIVDLSARQRSIDKVITDCFEQIVYSINQPTGARNFQAVFWNISYYDKYYFQSLFEHFVFPDGKRS